MKSEEMEPGKIYNTTHHMCMSIEGCLRNHRGRKIKIFNNEDGSQTSDKEARAYLAECQAKEWKVIPHLVNHVKDLIISGMDAPDI